MRVLTWNVNGLRSAARAGLWDHVRDTCADVVCLQETRLGRDGADDPAARPEGWWAAHHNSSSRPGHAGVAVFSRLPATVVDTAVFGHRDTDGQGRGLAVSVAGLLLVNVYMPHGGRDGSRVPEKLRAYDRLRRSLSREDGPVVLAGDLNVAHTDLDLARPAANRSNTMFTAPERARLDALARAGFVDAFRSADAHGRTYTWWPYAGTARARDVGWRIDYVLHRGLAAGAVTSVARPTTPAAVSDHAPVLADVAVPGGTDVDHLIGGDYERSSQWPTTASRSS